MFSITVNSRTLDLGPTLDVIKAFGEMGHLVPFNREYEDLFSVPQRDGDRIDQLEAVRIEDQAQKFLDEFGNGVSDQSRWVLQLLAGHPKEEFKDRQSVEASDE